MADYSLSSLDPPQRKTVRARALLRLGLAGGGTDVAPYCEEHSGAVLNITIHRFAYCFIELRTDQLIEFPSSDLGYSELFPASSEIPSSAQMVLHRGAYNRIIRDFCGGGPIPMTLTTHADACALSTQHCSSTGTVS